MLPYEEWGLPVRRPRVQVSLPPVNCMKYHSTSMSTGYKIKLTLFLFLVCFWEDPQTFKYWPLIRHFHTRSLPSLLARAKHKCHRGRGVHISRQPDYPTRVWPLSSPVLWFNVWDWCSIKSRSPLDFHRSPRFECAGHSSETKNGEWQWHTEDRSKVRTELRKFLCTWFGEVCSCCS